MTTPQVIVELGLAAGAAVPGSYMVFGDPSSLLGTAEYAPDNLLYQVPDTELNSFSCSRGAVRASEPLITYEAGQATITLVNQDGQYDPDNFQGPFAYAAGWSATTFAGGATVNNFVVSAADALKINVGDWVRFSVQPGGYQVIAVGVPSGGSAGVIVTPNAPGVLGAGTATQYHTMLTPQVAVRIRAVWDGTAYPLWAGFVTDWDPQYSGPEASYCVITAADGLGYLAQDGLRAELGAPVGEGELSGTRVNRILDSASWPGGSIHRDVDAGNSAMTGTTLPGTPLSELQAVADSELGAFYMSADGKAAFRSRRAILTGAMSAASQATFGSGAGELPYADRDLEHASARLANIITAGTDGGVPVTVQDTDSVTRYQARPFTRTDLLLEDPGEPLQWASLILYQCKDPEQWFAALAIDPRAAPDLLYPQVLGRDIGHRITVRRRPPGMPVISRDVFIRGAAHEYRQGYWRTAWALQSALKYDFLIFGTGVYGRDRMAF
jgi:hypothetical protein